MKNTVGHLEITELFDYLVLGVFNGVGLIKSETLYIQVIDVNFKN